VQFAAGTRWYVTAPPSPFGTLAELVPVPDSDGFPVPAGLDPALAAGARYIQVGNSAGAASTITGLVLRNKLLTLVGHSLFATPAEVRRSAYAQMAGHAIDGKLTVDLERTRLEDISGTWEHLKTGAPRKLVVTP